MLDSMTAPRRRRMRVVAGTDLDERARRRLEIREETYADLMRIIERRSAELRREGINGPIEQDVASWLIGTAADALLRSYVDDLGIPPDKARINAAIRFRSFARALCPPDEEAAR